MSTSTTPSWLDTVAMTNRQIDGNSGLQQSKALSTSVLGLVRTNDGSSPKHSATVSNQHVVVEVLLNAPVSTLEVGDDIDGIAPLSLGSVR